MTAQTILPLAAFAAHLNQHPDQPYLHQPRQGTWTTYSYAQVDKEARSIASALQAQGYQKGDRIGILAKNSAEWVMADLAIMMAGMISVPIYATAGTKTIDYVLQHSEVKALFVGKLDSTDAIQNIETKVTTVGFDYQGVIATDHKWSDWVNDHQPLALVPEYQPSDTLSIVYTSGSTGVPKGVIISHRNAVAGVAAVSEYLPEGEIRVLSYLPMAHITERAIVAMTSFYNDMQIFFNESLETFPADLQHAKVTVFISVPRLWTKFRAMVLAGMPDEQLQAVLKTEQGPAVAAQIRAKLGLAHCKFFGSGTAPISGALLQWYENLGMPIEEGWGMTELTGLACNNAPYDKANVGTIGTPCPGFDIRLSDAGEIQIKGPAVFEGYYLNEEITRDSFDDGWFKTGDLGEFTDTGALKIVGRVKEQFKTAKGKYVSPVPIESKLSACPLLEQVCVVGSGLPQPLALVVLSDIGKANEDASLAALQKVAEEVNSTLESHEKLDGVIVASDDWTIESGLLTPTLKLQRTAIEKKYSGLWDNKSIKGIQKEAAIG